MNRTNFSTNKQKMRILSLTHIKQANAIAWSFSRTTGISFEELKGEAELALCIAADKFDPSLTLCLTTLVHRCVTNNLVTFCKKFKNHKPAVADETKMGADCSREPAATTEFFDSLNHLGEEAKEIVNIILSGPSEILDVAIDATPCKIRIALKKYMLGKGTKLKAFQRGTKELKELFNY